MPNLIDAHCHLADEAFKETWLDEIDKALKVGVDTFISSALCEEEFEWHLNNPHPNVKWCAGIHPYYEKTDLKDFEKLIKLCDEKKIIGIGEIGLDKRGNFEFQKQILLQQLDLSRAYNLPVIFHVVGKYYELLKILKNNFPKVWGCLHSFNSSAEAVSEFSKLNLGFSLGSRLPKKDALKLIIQRRLLLLETDAPFQKPAWKKDSINHLSNLPKVADSICQLSGLDNSTLEKIQADTYKIFFGE